MKTRKFGTLSLNVLKLRTVKWGCLRTKNSTNSRIQQVINSGSGTRKSRSKQLYKRPSICNLKTENFRTKIFLLLTTLEFGTLKWNHVQNSRIAEISMPASCYLRKIIIASFTIFWPDSYDIERVTSSRETVLQFDSMQFDNSTASFVSQRKQVNECRTDGSLKISTCLPRTPFMFYVTINQKLHFLNLINRDIFRFNHKFLTPP